MIEIARRTDFAGRRTAEDRDIAKLEPHFVGNGIEVEGAGTEEQHQCRFRAANAVSKRLHGEPGVSTSRLKATNGIQHFNKTVQDVSTEK